MHSGVFVYTILQHFEMAKKYEYVEEDELPAFEMMGCVTFSHKERFSVHV